MEKRYAVQGFDPNAMMIAIKPLKFGEKVVESWNIIPEELCEQLPQQRRLQMYRNRFIMNAPAHMIQAEKEAEEARAKAAAEAAASTAEKKSNAAPKTATSKSATASA